MDASTITSTMREMPMPPAVMNGIRATASPRMATTTVPPAKTTDRPAVARERPTASSTSRPSERYSRKRVRMKSE